MFRAPLSRGVLLLLLFALLFSSVAGLFFCGDSICYDVSSLPAFFICKPSTIYNARMSQVLGVSRDADAATIRQAYHRKSLQLHPDKNPGDPTAEKADPPHRPFVSTLRYIPIPRHIAPHTPLPPSLSLPARFASAQQLPIIPSFPSQAHWHAPRHVTLRSNLQAFVALAAAYEIVGNAAMRKEYLVPARTVHLS